MQPQQESRPLPHPSASSSQFPQLHQGHLVCGWIFQLHRGCQISVGGCGWRSQAQGPGLERDAGNQTALGPTPHGLPGLKEAAATQTQKVA